MSRRAIVLGVVAGIAAIVPAFPAPAWSKPAAEYCFTTVLSESELEAGKTNAIACFLSEPQLVGAVASTLGVLPTDPLGLLPLSFANRRLARHYDAPYALGSNLSVYGTSCTGGGLNLTGTGWEDRISSTQHGACGAIIHYSATGFAGNSQLTTGGCGYTVAMNTLLNDDVSSIRYFTPESGWCSI